MVPERGTYTVVFFCSGYCWENSTFIVIVWTVPRDDDNASIAITNITGIDKGREMFVYTSLVCDLQRLSNPQSFVRLISVTNACVFEGLLMSTEFFLIYLPS